MNASEVLADAVVTLKASTAIDHWQRDREQIEADELLCFAMGVDRVRPGDDVPAGVRRRFGRMVERRASGEPVQLIMGHAVFRGLEIEARPGVFVPRDSTEFLAEQAVRRLRGRKHPVHVDLATGSGPVALAVAHEVPAADVHGADLAAEPIRVARQNAKRLGIRAAFHQGDLFGALPSDLAGRIDVITFHPPYVGNTEVQTLPAEVLAFEPLESLTDHSPLGMGLIERAADEAWDWLRPNGWLLVEVSPDRSRRVATV